jgi:hypothetical protein
MSKRNRSTAFIGDVSEGVPVGLSSEFEAPKGQVCSL